MKSLCVGIYGETCAGKSTLGKHLSSVMGCQYISFGDLKRQEISAGTEIGIAIKQLLAQNCPLPAELGCAVIRNKIASGLNFISGYPISVDEFNALSVHVSIIGIVALSVDETVLIQRFGLRRECPECHLPGIIGDVCSVHQIQMVQREDIKLDELIARRNLYRQRILPFLESRLIKVLPQLPLNSSVLAKEEVANQVERWIKKLLAKKEV